MRCAERIRELRKEHGYNQTHIAKALGVAQTTYSDYENNKIRIPIECVVKLARFYDVNLNFITGASATRDSFPKK